MDSKTAGVNKADDQSSSIYDHRKRKKDEVMNDNCTKTALSRVELKWVQSEEDVSMTLVLNPEDGDAGNVEVVFTDREMTIIFANNFEQKWYFYDAVVKEKSKVQRKKKTFTIQVIKRVPGMWPSLEKTEPSNKQMESEFDVETIAAFDKENADGNHEKIIKEEEPVHNLQHVKHDFFEKDGNLTVHIYVKAVPKDSVRVRFESHCYFVKFQTGDSRFLQLHEGTSEDTVFSWKVTTKNAILPNACKFKITQSFIELTLRKATPERWATLEAPQRKDLPMSSKSTSWIPAKGASDKRDGVNTSSATTSSSIEVSGQASTLAFDEMAQVNLNHQDSGSPDLPHSTTQAGFQQNSTFKSQKPTCKVQPLNKLQGDVPVVNPGFTGLDNLGNTCFMNSVIQVLSNTREFRDFFLDERFIHEINKDNVLGTGGQLALAFGTLLKTLWSGTKYSCPPSKLKDLVAKKASQFTGYAQHDAQEFMAFLLDGLHEDLNRVKRKPYTETVDSDGRPDEVVANEAWEVYKKRNDSFVVDLFQGQYKSKLVCPVCNKVSITFDPFLYLSVPLPKKKKSILVTFMWRDPHRKPVKYLLQLVRDSSVDHLKELLSRKTGVQPSDIRVFEAYRGLFHKQFTSGSDLSGVQPNDTIIAAEVLSPETAGEEVVEIPIIQRTLIPHQFPTRCSSCHKDCESGSKLKRCTKCFKVGYCDQSCQRLHWQAHRPQCNPSPEPVGCPFYLSLPHSQSTYSRVAHLMESHARYSVDTFQPPVKADIPCVIISNTTSGGGLQLPSHPSGSNLSSSSGSQSSGSLSSLDSISSCSSTATLTADTNRATFEIDVEEDVEQREEIDEDGYAGAGENILECSMPLDEGGGGDVDSGVESVQSSQIRALSQSLDYAEGDMGEEEDKEVAQQLACAHQNPSSGFGSSIDSFSEEKQAPTNPVLGVQSAAPAERSIPLFFIKPVNSDGHGVRGSAGERLEDRGDSPLDLSSYEYLSMDWRNSDKLPSYVLVQSKSLESEMDPSSHSAIYDDNGQLSLYQCLELFTEPETLAPDEAWYCPQCKKHREASKQLSLWRLPHTLIVQLKRFSFRNFIWRDKIDKMVEFPIRGLNLTDAMGGHGADQPPAIYDLYGVVNHHGGILGGHYTSMARCADLTAPLRNEVGWRLFDDSRVTPVTSEKNAVTRSAYLLFYRRREPFIPEPSRCLGISADEEEEIEPIDAIKNEKVEAEDILSNKLYLDADSSEMEYSEEKFDPEKEDEMTDSLEEGQGRLVMNLDDKPPLLDYTDMDAVD